MEQKARVENKLGWPEANDWGDLDQKNLDHVECSNQGRNSKKLAHAARIEATQPFESISKSLVVNSFYTFILLFILVLYKLIDSWS